jgi:hypothetical protein
VHSILLHPLHPDQLFVSNQSSTCYLMNMNGQVIKALQSGKRQGGGEEGVLTVHCEILTSFHTQHHASHWLKLACVSSWDVGLFLGSLAMCSAPESMTDACILIVHWLRLVYID